MKHPKKSARVVKAVNFRGGLSTYVLFENDQHQLLAYYLCPKNANTSAKLFFMKHLAGAEAEKLKFESDEVPQYLQKKDPSAPMLYDALPSKQPFADLGSIADLKICVTREPVARFLSAYKNRILWHRDKNFRDLSIDEVLEALSSGDFSNKHFLPQTYFLGHDPSYFDLVCDISEMERFENYVNNFFNDYSVAFPHLMKKSPEATIELTEERLRKIYKIYETDFEFLRRRQCLSTPQK